MPILVSLAFLRLNQIEKKQNLELSFTITSCLNFIQATIFNTGKDGQDYVFNNQFDTDFYRQNLADLAIIINDKKLDYVTFLSVVYDMESANNLLKYNNYYPTNKLRDAGKDIINKFNGLSINKRFCKTIVPSDVYNY